MKFRQWITYLVTFAVSVGWQLVERIKSLFRRKKQERNFVVVLRQRLTFEAVQYRNSNAPSQVRLWHNVMPIQYA